MLQRKKMALIALVFAAVILATGIGTRRGRVTELSAFCN